MSYPAGTGGGGITGAAKLLGTSGAVTWDPNTNPVGAIIITNHVTSITATAPVADNKMCWLILVGDGSHTWPTSVGNAALVGGTFTGPAGNGSVSILSFFGTSTLPGGAQWKQYCATAAAVS